MSVTWTPEDVFSSSCETTYVDGLRVTVCLDDEGPLAPAFYWMVENATWRITEGWASTVEFAKDDALDAAHRHRPLTFAGITTADEARDAAIEWSHWAPDQNLSLADLADWQEVFGDLADRFDLRAEFVENGII